MQDRMVLINLLLFGCEQGAVAVLFRNGVGGARNSYCATTGVGADILASHAQISPGDFEPGRALRCDDRGANGLDDLRHVNNDAAAQARAGAVPLAENFDVTIALRFTYEA